MSFLDTLLEDQRSLKKIREAGKEEIKRKELKIPDAIVLIKRTFVCKNCKEVYIIPNHKPLFRFEKNLVKIKFWLDRFNSILKREIVEFNEEIMTCEKCFDNVFFSSEDFGIEKKG